MLVPRFLWPDKPVINDIGGRFNLMATGNANSSLSPGYFADVYWAQGRTVDLIWMPLLGALLTFYSRFTVRMLAAGRHFCFPLVLLAMKMGLRVDGSIVADVIGGSAFWFVGFAAMKIAEPWVDMLVGTPPPRRAT